jgi:LysR family hydrogen peroxide-inducible transcriptional activator
MRLRDHIEKLNYYVAALEFTSLREASKAIGIGQPQLTKVINQLEDLLECQLVVRSRSGISITQEGQILYDQGKRILSEVDQLEFSIHSDNQQLHGEITIGTYDSISRYFFPDFIKYMKAISPNLNINLYTGRSQDLIKKIERSQIDLSIFVGAPSSSLIKSEVVYTDYFKFYQPQTLDLAFSKTLIYFPGSVKNADFQSITGKYKNFHQCENLETVLSLTTSGLGVGLLPTRVAKGHLINGQLRQLPQKNTIAKHDISIARPKEKFTQEAALVYDEALRFLNIWSQK